jgi:hypothetical protein
MPGLITRAARLTLQPEREWAAIALEHSDWLRVLFRYLVPLLLVAPIANACGVLIGNEVAFHAFADSSERLRFALKSALGAFAGSLFGVLVTASVVYLVTPLYQAVRDFSAAFRLVAYAGTPVWLAGVVLVAPLQRFALLVVIILIALIHALFLFYLGLHHVLKVRRRDAAECTAVVAFASLALSTVIGYVGGGLLPPM